MKNKLHLLPLFLSGLMLVKLPAQIAAWPDFSSITTALNTIPTPVKSAFIQIPLTYGALYARTALHECGHAAAALANKIKINGLFLGCEPNASDIRESRNTFVLRLGLNPLLGGTLFDQIQFQSRSHPYKKAIISAVGPLVGLMSAYIFLKSCNKITNHEILKLGIYYIFLNDICNLLPNKSGIDEIDNMISKTNQNSDGTILCESLAIPISVTAPLAIINSLLSILGPLCIDGLALKTFIKNIKS